MKVAFVAAPLTARTGVYRSARELVAAGRSQGHDWRLLLGVSESASGERPVDDPQWIDEFSLNPGGVEGIVRLRSVLRSHSLVATADLVVSLIPQSDMALATMRVPWIAYVRGLPWPASGESSFAKRSVWRGLERLALKRARAVWATTRVLSDQLEWRRGTTIVPAGIRPIERTVWGDEPPGSAVWAARFHHDKNPRLFLQAVEGQGFPAKMYGSGELEQQLRAGAPANVDIVGWSRPEELWAEAFVYVGTSFREAFGRSALEAAMSGVPIVISDAFGVAEHLVTDEEMRRRFVLPVSDISRWRSALRDLHTDVQLRSTYSDHLVNNASKLTIDRSAEAVAAGIKRVLGQGRTR
ncbi:glycosyltransferase family 4 protein [Microbacterium sp. JZ37]|uniref:glycosyltransferase family 4 protein n=1 Tax=Microbacterium sp. JZ37 TaxID=2654193 RepID=UPI00308AC093|nr:glycosyltransferase [Microbacterium sp. JZ37]